MRDVAWNEYNWVEDGGDKYARETNDFRFSNQAEILSSFLTTHWVIAQSLTNSWINS